MKIIIPGSVIGIIGGGQLGRMTALEAKKMGYKIACLDPNENAPCNQIADIIVTGEINNAENINRLAQVSDVVIYEFEHINTEVLFQLDDQGKLPQRSDVLGIAQNRQREKDFFAKNGFPVGKYHVISNGESFKEIVTEYTKPYIIKTTTQGYDGKGQYIITDEEIENYCSYIIQASNCEWIIEEFVPFIGELSVIVARKGNGEMRAFPVTENIHKEGILHISIVPARFSEKVQQEAIAIAKEIAELLKIVGLLTIEFFVTEKGILINEMAPRPHNSGHWTMDSCETSQFEQFVRAVCGLPLGYTDYYLPTIMVNLFERDFEPLVKNINLLSENAYFHLYGKAIIDQPMRKFGHVNFIRTDLETVSKMVNNLLKRELF